MYAKNSHSRCSINCSWPWGQGPWLVQLCTLSNLALCLAQSGYYVIVSGVNRHPFTKGTWWRGRTCFPDIWEVIYCVCHLPSNGFLVSPQKGAALCGPQRLLSSYVGNQVEQCKLGVWCFILAFWLFSGDLFSYVRPGAYPLLRTEFVPNFALLGL